MEWLALLGMGLQLYGAKEQYNADSDAAVNAELAAKWNKKVNFRTALMYQMAADQQILQKDLAILDFREKYRKYEKDVEAKIVASGVDAYSGTGLQILLENAEQAGTEIRNIDFNGRLAARELNERATSALLSADMVMFQGEMQAQGIKAGRGVSLMQSAANIGMSAYDTFG